MSTTNPVSASLPRRRGLTEQASDAAEQMSYRADFWPNY